VTKQSNLEPKKKKIPRKITAKSLENAALYYLRRYSSSSENFRRVMTRRVNRSVQYHNTNTAEGLQIIDRLIEKFTKIGLLNDLRFAEASTANFRRLGLSERMIRAKLVQKGLSSAVINQCFQLLKSNNLDSELTASIIFSRRRRIGAFRGSKNKRQKFYDQDMARLARAGFSYYIAQKVIGIENREELEQMVDNNTFDP
jgi:regulatory protein